MAVSLLGQPPRLPSLSHGRRTSVDERSTLILGGGGGGIGRAITRAFGTDGAAVAVADMVPERAREAADEISTGNLPSDDRHEQVKPPKWFTVPSTKPSTSSSRRMSPLNGSAST